MAHNTHNLNILQTLHINSRLSLKKLLLRRLNMIVSRPNNCHKIIFVIAQPRHRTSCKPSVHIRHFHGSKNEQILIFQNRFQLIVNTHSRNAFVRLQEIASGHKQQCLTNFVELLSKLFHPCRILYVKIHNIEYIKLTQSLSLQI